MAEPQKPSTIAQKLCSCVLNAVRDIDADASISTVSKWDHDDSTMVRVRSGVSAPLALLKALRDQFPLATVSTVENLIDGSTQAQILIPSKNEQFYIARSMATQNRRNLWLKMLTRLLLFVFSVLFAMFVAGDVAR